MSKEPSQRIQWIFLSAVFSHATAWALSLSVPPCALPPGDGTLRLWYAQHREFTEITYDPKMPDIPASAQSRFNRALRSPDGRAGDMDPQLIRLLDTVQDHFVADTIEIISGFRSPAYNADLKAQGHNVARESLHTQGRAVDVHIDEIDEAALRDYAQSLQCGGVGYYPANAFVHVDLGPVRTWQEAPARARQWIGERPITWQTDRNRYAVADTARLTRAPADESLPRDTPLVLEHFERGAWKTIGKPFVPQPTLSLAQLPFGKYRLRSTVAAGGYSNEWYVKR